MTRVPPSSLSQKTVLGDRTKEPCLVRENSTCLVSQFQEGDSITILLVSLDVSEIRLVHIAFFSG